MCYVTVFILDYNSLSLMHSLTYDQYRIKEPEVCFIFTDTAFLVFLLQQ